MAVFDKTYDESLHQVLEVTHDREQAKKLLGEIYTETWEKMKRGSNNIEDVERYFWQTKASHGIR